jgi:hypothetical protein
MKASDILEKAIGRAQCMDLKKAVSDGLKKCHDAMYHHALHAEAANRAGKKEEARKHMLALMQHAVENVKDRDSIGIKMGVNDNVNHYGREASESLIPYGFGDSLDKPGQKLHPATKHFKEGGKFVPHKGDKKLGHSLKKAWTQEKEQANKTIHPTSEGGAGDYWKKQAKAFKPWKKNAGMKKAKSGFSGPYALGGVDHAEKPKKPKKVSGPYALGGFDHSKKKPKFSGPYALGGAVHKSRSELIKAMVDWTQSLTGQGGKKKVKISS